MIYIYYNTPSVKHTMIAMNKNDTTTNNNKNNNHPEDDHPIGGEEEEKVINDDDEQGEEYLDDEDEDDDNNNNNEKEKETQQCVFFGDTKTQQLIDDDQEDDQDGGESESYEVVSISDDDDDDDQTENEEENEKKEETQQRDTQQQQLILHNSTTQNDVITITDDALREAVNILFEILNHNNGDDCLELFHDELLLHSLLHKFPEAAKIPLEGMELVDDYGNRFSFHGYAFHMACYRNAPLPVLCALVRVWPEAARQRSYAHSVFAYERCDGNYVPPLHIALRNATVSFEVIEFLLEQWPESIQWIHYDDDNENNKKNENNENDIENQETALHWACLYGVSVPIIQYLVHQWPQALQIRSQRGLPLHCACICETPSTQTIAYLLMEAYGASPTALLEGRDGLLLSALKEACLNPKTKAEQMEVLIQYLPTTAVSFHHHCYHLDALSFLPLHSAALHVEDVKVIALLIQHFPAAVKINDQHYGTPLHCACSSEHNSLIKQQMLVQAWPEALRETWTKRKNNASAGSPTSTCDQHGVVVVVGGLLPLHTALDLTSHSIFDIILARILSSPHIEWDVTLTLGLRQ